MNESKQLRERVVVESVVSLLLHTEYMIMIRVSINDECISNKTPHLSPRT